MLKAIRKQSLQMVAAMFVGMTASSNEAHANNFSDIAQNITISIENMPGLLTGLAYMFGVLLGVLGILKIKDHVENPQQIALKDGAIRLLAGGGLFALPIVFEAMRETMGAGGGVSAATLNKVSFAVN